MSQKYREVKRKANVGDRIRIVNPKCASGYGLGDEGAVVETAEAGVYANLRGDRRGVWHSEYVVLEPIETTADISELFAKFIRENSGTIRKYLDEIEVKTTEAPPIPEAKTLTRAEVIARAKADVAELTKLMGGPLVQAEGNETYRYRTTSPEFFVNREKRAVTVLVRKKGNYGMYSDGHLFEKATAKASPDDVFNADIGKAIVLRRALGLTIPDEYINAPQPDEPRVGAVVQTFTAPGTFHRTVIVKKVLSGGGVLRLYPDARLHGHTPYEPDVTGDYISDDTDVNYEEVA